MAVKDKTFISMMAVKDKTYISIAIELISIPVCKFYILILIYLQFSLYYV